MAGHQDRHEEDPFMGELTRRFERAARIEQEDAPRLLKYLETLEDQWVHLFNESMPTDDIGGPIPAMNNMVGEIAMLVDTIAWHATMDHPLRTDRWPYGTHVVARLMELTDTHSLGWWYRNPVLYLAAEAITERYWAREKRLDWLRTEPADQLTQDDREELAQPDASERLDRARGGHIPLGSSSITREDLERLKRMKERLEKDKPEST